MRARDLLSNVTLLFSEKSRRDKRRQKGLRHQKDTQKEGKTAGEKTNYVPHKAREGGRQSKRQRRVLRALNLHHEKNLFI